MGKTIKAFSLAEMMVVMLILSLVLAASMPIITRRVHRRTEDAIPFGAIIIWHGSVASIPSGWHLCDGTYGTPDLRSRFVYGAGTLSVGTTGGEETHVLTVAEMPSHSHSGVTNTTGAHTHKYNSWENYSVQAFGWGTNWHLTQPTDTSSAGDHFHIISAEGGDSAHNTMPPYMVLAYIMKL